MSDKPTTEWPDGLAEAIPDDVATDRSGLEKPMGYSARQNETARKAAAGELLSRRSLMGAMDHALEIHASALRLLEAKNTALKERVEKLELAVAALLREAEQSAIGRVEKLYRPPVELPPPSAKPPTICATCGAVGPSGFHHVHDALADGPAYWVAPTEQT